MTDYSKYILSLFKTSGNRGFFYCKKLSLQKNNIFIYRKPGIKIACYYDRFLKQILEVNSFILVRPNIKNYFTVYVNASI